jgi:hypothetical protein
MSIETKTKKAMDFFYGLIPDPINGQEIDPESQWVPLEEVNLALTQKHLELLQEKAKIVEANKILNDISELNESYPLIMIQNKDDINIQILERNSNAEDILPSLCERQQTLVNKLKHLCKVLEIKSNEWNDSN